MNVTISATGTARFLYTEELDLRGLGAARIERASHVEPDTAGRWWADMSPVHGPRLGPFTLRSAALAAEVDWLERNRL